MSATLTKFEVYGTWTQRFDPSFATFIETMIGIATPIYNYQVSTIASGDVYGQGPVFYGLIPPSNNASALSALNTLNASLTAVSLGTVTCISYSVISQP